MASPSTIDQIMTREVDTCPPSATVQQVARLMADRNVGAVPVAEQSRLVGMVTDRDIAIRVVAAGADPRSERIERYVSRDVQTLPPGASLDEARRLMERHQIRRLPVVDGGRLVGIVSLGDLATKGTPGGQGEAEIGEALEEISKPSRPRPKAG